MTRMNRRFPRRACALGAGAVLVTSIAVTFFALLSSAPADASTTSIGSSGLRYPLLPVTAAPRASLPKGLVVAVAPAPVHGGYTKTTDECAACHRTHTGKNKNVLKEVSLQENTCYTCHDGTGSSKNIKADYQAVPANNDTTRLFYRHNTTQTIQHTSASLNEFGGQSNRHSECSDCHDAHLANATDNTTTATGVTASGRLEGVSGVSVVNGAAGTAPTYTFLDGKTPATSITREYQLCFKCHSGFTVLDNNAGFVPSRYRLDKGVEFNPNNAAYHPIEAQGKNQTQKMADSLSGPSSFKIWNFTPTSKISCANCHSSPNKYSLVSPPSPNGALPLHGSPNSGMLLQPYKNRVLKVKGEAYREADFALCFMCHSSRPFTGPNISTDTNFPKHGSHVADINSGAGVGITLDQPGAGEGHAICAECHFRQHSSTFKLGNQVTDGSRLVNFAPNVTEKNGELNWTHSATPGQSSCALTCHGHSHSNTKY